ARRHKRASIGSVTPGDFDPESFLRAIILTQDPSVKHSTRMRARRLLTRRDKDRPPTCGCYRTPKARDEIELHAWVAEMREVRKSPAETDSYLAALVRSAARGEKLEPSHLFRRTSDALNDVVREGVTRARGDAADAQE